jgi:hypothetical protein
MRCIAWVRARAALCSDLQFGDPYTIRLFNPSFHVPLCIVAWNVYHTTPLLIYLHIDLMRIIRENGNAHTGHWAGRLLIAFPDEVVNICMNPFLAMLLYRSQIALSLSLKN